MTIFQGQPDLLRAFRDGERDALRRVYLHYFDDIYRLVAYGFTLSGASPVRVAGLPETERLDAVQEVFLRAFQPRARLAYDGLREYRPYLRRIAKNLRIDQLRAEGRSAPQADSELLDLLPAESEDAGSDESSEQRMRLATAEYLAAQSEEVRRFTELRFVRELSQAEVAAEMHVTRRRVRTLESTVQRGLRKWLRSRRLW